MAHFTFAQLCRDMRGDAGITIDNLAALSREGVLVALRDGLVLDPVDRTTIMRYEDEDKPPKRPQDAVLWSYCYAMSLAFHQAGQDRPAHDIYNMLRASLREVVTLGDVSREAAALDSIMRTISEPAYSMIYETLIATARKWRDLLRQQQAEAKVAKRRDGGE
jgi:hypothetical protein